MSSTSATKMVLLKSSDGLTFEMDEAAALQSQTIRHMIEDGCADSVIPVENVTSNILAKVIEYCNNHTEKVLEIDVAEEELEEFKIDVATKEPDTDEKNPKIDEEELKTFDQEFVDADTNTVYDLIMAANFLDIKSFLDLTCQRVADMIKGKKPEEIRQIFNIENNFTPDQEEEVRRENSWAFDE